MVDHHDADRFSLGMMFDHPGHLDPLLNIKVGTGFVKYVEIGIPGEAPGNCHPLELPAAQGINRGLEDDFKRERLNDLVLVQG